MKVTRAEIVGVMRNTDRRATSGPFDRERFLAPNGLTTELQRMNPERRGYLLRQLVLQWLDAGAINNAVDLLTNFDFLAAKAAEHLLPELLRDYDAVIDSRGGDEASALRRLRRALELGRSLLEDDPGQLPEQLLGRLDPTESRELASLLNRATGYKKEPWLRPLAGHLTSPDSPLVRTLVGPSRAD